MKRVFDAAVVGGVLMKNRVVRSATHESLAERGGRVGAAMLQMYEELAKGDVGLIITGFMSFGASDNPSERTLLIGDDDCISGLSSLTEVVHRHGGRIMAQLAHVGSQLTYVPTGEVFAPSAVIDPISGITPKPFATDEIEALVKEFGQAAFRAKSAGFDGVQLHGAHGYLLSRFLSPVYNKRTDSYGGSPEKNARILVDTLKEIKACCGDAYPVWVKLNASDFGRGEEGFDSVAMQLTARKLETAGIDAIELSGGTFSGEHSACRSVGYEAYHLPYAKELASVVSVPLVTVGGYRRLEVVESALEVPGIEAVSICRALIREPGLVRRWRQGDTEKAVCVACNGCFNPNGVRCFFNLEGEERAAQKEVMKMLSSLSD